MKYLGRIFLTGVLTVLPVLATVYLLIWLFTTAESFLGRPLQMLIPAGFYRVGMGLAVGIGVIFVVGVLMLIGMIGVICFLKSRLNMWQAAMRPCSMACEDTSMARWRA